MRFFKKYEQEINISLLMGWILFSLLIGINFYAIQEEIIVESDNAVFLPSHDRCYEHKLSKLNLVQGK
jgi:hypothetical protein